MLFKGLAAFTVTFGVGIAVVYLQGIGSAPEPAPKSNVISESLLSPPDRYAREDDRMPAWRSEFSASPPAPAEPAPLSALPAMPARPASTAEPAVNPAVRRMGPLPRANPAPAIPDRRTLSAASKPSAQFHFRPPAPANQNSKGCSSCGRKN